MSDGAFDAAVGQLRQNLAETRKSDVWRQIVEPRDGVFARFQPLLTAEYIPSLSADEIRPFFYLEHNHHWSSLYRQVNRVCGDMVPFREVLLGLVDETQPIAKRLDNVIGKVTGLGKGILSALLIIAHPNKYGVWNSTSEGGLIVLGLFPEFDRGTSFGAKHESINAILNRLATALDIDLWTLDALWWSVVPAEETEENPATEVSVSSQRPQSKARFGLERHLQNFLRDNWDHTELSRNWAIYTELGEPEAGYEFRCSVGSNDIGHIDLLARHRHEGKWLVIELKRERTSDQTVGQILRYIGWIQTHLAEADETVEGLIISQNGDEKLNYAVSAVPNLTFMTYEVEFSLTPSALSELERQQ